MSDCHFSSFLSFCSLLSCSFRFFDHMCAKPLSILLLSFFYISPLSLSFLFRFFDHVFIPVVSEEVRDDSMLCLSMYNLCACACIRNFNTKKNRKRTLNHCDLFVSSSSSLFIWRWPSLASSSINVLETWLNNRNCCTTVGY